MSKGPHLPQYYAEDKDIFDILMSRQRNFDNASLLKLARRRGIYLSPETDREQIADYLARLVWSWPELRHLLELAESAERREKFTSSRFSIEAAIDKVRAAVESVKETREQKNDEAFTVRPIGTDKLAVNVRYTEFDPSRTRLQQRVTRDVTLEFEKSVEGYTLRHQANDHAKEIGRDILASIQEITKETTAAAEITLRGITKPEFRTLFFETLMQKMPDMDAKTVTSISVNRSASSLQADDDQDEPEGAAHDTATDEASRMLGEVKKAVLDGENLLESEEFRRLCHEGFFLSRSVWRSGYHNKPAGPEIEFEAGFEDPKHCEGFRYDVRGSYECRTRGEEGLKKVRAPVPPELRLEMLRAIEDSARNALAAVLQLSTNPDTGSGSRTV